MYYLLRTISLLPLLAGVLAHKSPVPSRELGNKSQEDPQQQQQQPPPLAPTATVIPDAGAILDALLKRVQIETIIINATLARYPDPLSEHQQTLVTTLVGLGFSRITELLQSADEMLKAIPVDPGRHLVLAGLDNNNDDDDDACDEDEGDEKEDEGEKKVVVVVEGGGERGGSELAPGNMAPGRAPCGKVCMSRKMNNIVKEVGHTALRAVLKTGLHLLGKHVNPAFLALSGCVLTVNTLTGGSLVVVSALVNGVFLAISAGIAYLGKLVSDKERHRVGGPAGFKTREIAQMLELLGRTAVD